jgi:hypothetical protein
MEDEKRLMNCITYALGEVKPSYQRRQMQVLESHLRLVNLVTESINQLSQEQLAGHCFRASKHKSPVHLQFVPINLHLQQSLFANPTAMNGSSLSGALSRIALTDANHEQDSSVSSEEDADELSPILNVYTHGAFCVHALGLEQGCDRTFRELCGQTRTDMEIGRSSRPTSRTQLGHTWSAMETYFRITHMAQQVSRLTNDLMQLLEQLNQAQTALPKPTDSDRLANLSAGHTEVTATVAGGLTGQSFNALDVTAKQSLGPSQLQFNQLQQRFAVQQQTWIAHQQRLKTKLLSVFSKLEFECQQIANILDANQSESILARLDGLRLTSNATSSIHEANDSFGNSGSVTSTALRNRQVPPMSGMERTISCPINQLLKSPEAQKQAERKLNQLRRCSSGERLDEANEFEPVELTQLNIRASVISMQSKLNQLSRLSDNGSAAEGQTNPKNSGELTSKQLCSRLQEDLKPCVRKLSGSVQSLQRTSAVCYALQALQLSRDQLEQFYALRLRRDALFSQALSTLVIALLGQLNSTEGSSLLARLFEQRTLLCVFEGLLSCYADEIAMLQDMQFALNELARCVRLKFVPLDRPDSSTSSDTDASSNGTSSYARSNTSHMSGPRLEGNGQVLYHDQNFLSQIKIIFY